MVDRTRAGAGQFGVGQNGTTTAATPTAGPVPTSTVEDSALGSTTIAATVVRKTAAMAAREVPGVHAMGTGVSRAVGALRERIPGGGVATSSVSGIAVEVGQKQAAVDLEVIVEYGAPITELAPAVRRNVIDVVERMTGLEVVEVNIAVNDIHLPGRDSEPDMAVAGPRVE